VHQHLNKRPSLIELSAQGVIDSESHTFWCAFFFLCFCHCIPAETDTQLAPRLTATAKKLERNLVQNQVGHLLESRPDKDDLVTHNIFEDPEHSVAPSLQGPKHQLERKLKADKISQQLRKRPSVTELEEKGIVTGT
jgi:hypothetical protein